MVERPQQGVATSHGRRRCRGVFPGTGRAHLVGMKQLLPLLPLACLSFASGCGFHHLALRDGSVHNEEAQYTLSNLHDFTGEGWNVDNFRGGPRRSRSPKADGRYQTSFRFDLNADGVNGRWVSRPSYDLWMVHQQTGAILWVRTLVLPERLAERSLDHLFTAYVRLNSPERLGTPRLFGRLWPRDVREVRRRLSR